MQQSDSFSRIFMRNGESFESSRFVLMKNLALAVLRVITFD